MREAFGSRFAFVAVAIGMAVGTANMWRFPGIATKWGGASFLMALVLANLVWAITILMSGHSWDRRAGWAPSAISEVSWAGSREYAA